MPVFIILAKWRKRPTAETIKKVDELWAQFKKEGGRRISGYWTLGRYDGVITMEAPNERAAMKALVRWGEFVQTETLLAIERDEAVKLLE